MTDTLDLHTMDAPTARLLVQRLMGELQHKQALVDKLTFENAMLKRLKFATTSEALNAGQRSLLDETLDEDLQAVSVEIEQLQSPQPQTARNQPKRQPLPVHLPRTTRVHEPADTQCCGQSMQRIGEEVSEKLDYTPGVFTVQRHIRGKWACACCQGFKVQPVPAHIIDKGMATSGLLAHVLVAKYADHLPLYRQETIFERAGMAIPRSTLAQWVGSCGV